MPDLADDGRWLRGPDERFGIAVVDPQVVADGGDQSRYTGEGTATDALAGDVGEPALHQVQPRSAGGCEVQMVARVFGEPLLHLGVRVGAIVIEDQMDLTAARDRVVNALQELQELAVPMTRQAASNHRAVEDVEGREQRVAAGAFEDVGLWGRDARSHLPSRE